METYTGEDEGGTKTRDEREQEIMGKEESGRGMRVMK